MNIRKRFFALLDGRPVDRLVFMLYVATSANGKEYLRQAFKPKMVKLKEKKFGIAICWAQIHIWLRTLRVETTQFIVKRLEKGEVILLNVILFYHYYTLCTKR